MHQMPAAKPKAPSSQQAETMRKPVRGGGGAAAAGRSYADSGLMALQAAADNSGAVQAVMQLRKVAEGGGTQGVLQQVSPRTASNGQAAPGGVLQMVYDDALRLESAHAVRSRLTKAVVAAGNAASKEIRWREAQKPDSPLAERAGEFQAAMQESLDEFDRQFQVLRVWYNSEGPEKLTKEALKAKGLEDIERGNDFFDRLLSGAMASYKREADKQYQRGSGQNELLLGYRASVARDENPKEKILDTNIWSWGVNQAWIEGGASNKANFVLDTGIGDTALGYLSYMSGAAFLEAIKPENWPQGEANNLWHNRDDRPTWYALELAGLLDMGYRPNAAQTQMEPPHGNTTEISKDVQGIGVGAYIRDEG